VIASVLSLPEERRMAAKALADRRLFEGQQLRAELAGLQPIAELDLSFGELSAPRTGRSRKGEAGSCLRAWDRRPSEFAECGNPGTQHTPIQTERQLDADSSNEAGAFIGSSLSCRRRPRRERDRRKKASRPGREAPTGNP